MRGSVLRCPRRHADILKTTPAPPRIKQGSTVPTQTNDMMYLFSLTRPCETIKRWVLRTKDPGSSQKIIQCAAWPASAKTRPPPDSAEAVAARRPNPSTSEAATPGAGAWAGASRRRRDGLAASAGKPPGRRRWQHGCPLPWLIGLRQRSWRH